MPQKYVAVVICLMSSTGLLDQVYGPESSGKTTLAYHAMAEVQKAGGTAALIDAEHAFDPTYCRVLLLSLSVDTQNGIFLRLQEACIRLHGHAPMAARIREAFAAGPVLVGQLCGKGLHPAQLYRP